jgi:dolichyl-diphosphooligosaccharide---protein glycosyltransferase
VGEGIKDKLSSRLEPFGRLRLEISHGTIIAIAALALILFVAFVVRLLPLRWENLVGGTAYLNEFDPYYQFSATQHMINNGLLSPFLGSGWVNMQKWYPWGLNMQGTLPSLPMTAAVLYDIIKVFGANIDLMTFTSILPAIIGMFDCLIIYFLGKDYGGKTVGLFAALFLALAPSFLQRSSLGFFDTEVPGVLGLLLFTFLFLRSIDGKRSIRSSLIYSLGAGAALAYFIGGWGASYYILDLAALFVFVMVVLKRYSQRLLISYSVVFGLALFIATKVPYIGNQYLLSGAVVPVAAVFVILLIAEILRNNISMKSKLTLAVGTLVVGSIAFIALWAGGFLGALTGKFSTVLDPFIRAASPLINSVAEQRISGWGNIYTELGIAILFFLVGLYFTLRNPTNRNIFILLFSVTSLYFAASMVRLLVIFAPAFAIIAGMGLLSLIKPFYTLLQESPRSIAKAKRKLARVSKEYSGVAVFIIFMLLVTEFAFAPTQVGTVPRPIAGAYIPTAISASSLPLGGTDLNQPVTAWLDAIKWLNENAKPTDVVVAWWDYGNWLADLGNVTSFADNTTVNGTQIENLGFIFMGNENQSMHMLNTYNSYNNPGHVKYIMVFTVLQIGQSSSSSSSYIAYPSGYGDEGKWSWMARISGEAKNRLVENGYMNPATAWTDETAFGAASQQTGRWEWNDQGMNSTVYKLMNYAEVDYTNQINQISGLGYTLSPDATATIPTYFTKAYFAGETASPFQYKGLVPIVAIYEINYDAYYAATGATGTGTS